MNSCRRNSKQDRITNLEVRHALVQINQGHHEVAQRFGDRRARDGVPAHARGQSKIRRMRTGHADAGSQAMQASQARNPTAIAIHMGSTHASEQNEVSRTSEVIRHWKASKQGICALGVDERRAINDGEQAVAERLHLARARSHVRQRAAQGSAAEKGWTLPLQDLANRRKLQTN